MRSTLLEDLIQPAGARAGSDTSHPVYSVTKHNGFVPSSEYFKNQVYSRELAAYKRVIKGDFAYATIHLDEGSIGIAPADGLISPMYTVFRPKVQLVEPNYLLRYLKSPAALAQYPRFGKGSVHRRKSISLEALGKLPIPLPSLEEQRRLAAMLDAADSITVKRRGVLTHLDSLAKSAMAHFLADANGRECRLRELVDRDDRLNYGVVQPGPDVAGGVPLVRVSDLRDGLVERTALKPIGPDVDRANASSRLRGRIAPGCF